MLIMKEKKDICVNLFFKFLTRPGARQGTTTR
jgi:hypothetical protein